MQLVLRYGPDRVAALIVYPEHIIVELEGGGRRNYALVSGIPVAPPAAVQYQHLSHAGSPGERVCRAFARARRRRWD